MSNSQVLQLQEPLTDGGIRAVNFFNGRLLTARDLSREQQARRDADLRLGLALGEGVALGFGVTADADLSEPRHPVVRIEEGLAVNRQGQTLRLEAPVSVALTRPFARAGTDCLFNVCDERIVGGTYVAGIGLFALTIAPAEKPEGRAADSGFDPENVRCNTDTTVEALQFRLLQLNRKDYADLDVTAPDFRNAIAYRCFGTGVQPQWLAGLLGAETRGDDLLDTLRPSPLSDRDVPLALLLLTGAADVQFIDRWSVRRPLALPHVDGPLPGLADSGRIAVGQAMFRQFQDQVAAWAPSGDLGATTARTHCRYLPPVGILPVPEETDATDAKATHFFKGMTYRGPAFINAARLEALVRDGFLYPPIDTQDEELVWLYRVRENRMAIDLATGARRTDSYLIFASGHLPYIGDAQFDLARFKYSNYALAR